MRQFNTAGPINPADHYHIPPLERIDLEEVLGLVRDKKYFVLHAPRQTGKTSALLALRDLLNGGEAGDWRCVYANVEAGQAARENVRDAMRAVLSEFALRASLTLGDDSVEGICHAAMDSAGPMGALGLALSRWAAADRTPLVLLIDEIDSLVGDTLLSVLRQVRAGYDRRPAAFPHSIILCGVHDVRDYRIHSTAEQRMVLGGSAFNIKSESLRLGDFSDQEIRALLAQHTAATGQAFTVAAQEMIGSRTAGQPWLVNALCYDACFRHKPGRDRSRPITENAIRGGTGAADPAPRYAHRRSGEQAARGARAARDRADSDRRRRAGVVDRGPADRVAAGRTREPLRGGVQDAARGASADHRGGRAADPRLPGPVRGGGGPPDRLRPVTRAKLGPEDLPPYRPVRHGHPGHGMGHVTRRRPRSTGHITQDVELTDYHR